MDILKSVSPCADVGVSCRKQTHPRDSKKSGDDVDGGKICIMTLRGGCQPHRCSTKSVRYARHTPRHKLILIYRPRTPKYPFGEEKKQKQMHIAKTDRMTHKFLPREEIPGAANIAQRVMPGIGLYEKLRQQLLKPGRYHPDPPPPSHRNPHAFPLETSAIHEGSLFGR